MKRTCKWLSALAAATMLLAGQSSWAWSFGGIVWEDCDRDGIKQSGEQGIEGIRVEVRSCVDGTLAAYGLTGPDGIFVFYDTHVPLYGTYQVCYLISSNCTFSPKICPPPPPSPSAYPTQIVSTAVAEWGGCSPCFTFDERFIDGDFTLNNAGICCCEKPPCNPGTGTPGYWKNHPEAWPVSSITLGGVTYTKQQAIDIMKLPTKGDKTLNLAEQLIAAKLNGLIGNDSSCVASTITAADAFLATYPIGSKLAASSIAWVQTGSSLLTMLDNYNNGKLCAPPRD